MPRRRKYLPVELSYAVTATLLVAIIIFFVVAGDYLPGATDWLQVNRHLIMCLPYLFVIFIGIGITVALSGPFALIGCTATGISFALMIDYLATNGVIDLSKSIGAFLGGNVTTVGTVIIITSVLIGLVLATRRRRLRW